MSFGRLENQDGTRGLVSWPRRRSPRAHGSSRWVHGPTRVLDSWTQQ